MVLPYLIPSTLVPSITGTAKQTLTGRTAFRKTAGIWSSYHLLIRCTLLLLVLSSLGCGKPQNTRLMEVTAYCSCASCCSWERGSPQWLKLDFWNRYVSKGAAKGSPYSGLTADGSVPAEPEDGLFSIDSVQRPWMIPTRLVLFPWLLLPHDGTIAADTKYYPFGTRIHVPGYGWGVVQDRGGAIKGPDRIDLYYSSHSEALQWGRKKVEVTIEYPEK